LIYPMPIPSPAWLSGLAQVLFLFQSSHRPNASCRPRPGLANLQLFVHSLWPVTPREPFSISATLKSKISNLGSQPPHRRTDARFSVPRAFGFFRNHRPPTPRLAVCTRSNPCQRNSSSVRSKMLKKGPAVRKLVGQVSWSSVPPVVNPIFRVHPHGRQRRKRQRIWSMRPAPPSSVYLLCYCHHLVKTA
jgi:hypothetical protein